MKANHKQKYLIWAYDFRDSEKHKGPKSELGVYILIYK